MVKESSGNLDAKFQALAHPIRRDLLGRLGRGAHTVSTLAEPYTVSAPAISKHLKVLEEAGLITRERHGREHHVQLVPDGLLDAAGWLARHRAFWNERLDALETLLAETSEQGEAHEDPDDPRHHPHREDPR